MCVTQEYIEALNNNKIIHWFGQNTTIMHPKLTTLPIGIANSQWEHGNLNTMEEVIKMKNSKSKLLYVNFNVGTNSKIRSIVKSIMIKNGYEFIESNLKFKEYLLDMSSYKFAICPEGNGPDCHRIWECLYLGTIPIVHNIVSYQEFSDLPILMIDDWNIVTDDFLNHQYELFSNKKYNLSKLSFSYWKDTILASLNEYASC